MTFKAEAWCCLDPRRISALHLSLQHVHLLQFGSLSGHPSVTGPQSTPGNKMKETQPATAALRSSKRDRAWVDHEHTGQLQGVKCPIRA